ncbi:uncharacterized protein LOC126234346 [Schistocerca nitens]|uniref:uncharacterized protein LOC126234346 n=1 Tax=Schistocerca nitens TaxID=7011 RepID=UPI0021173FD1|nr:uncharacterized protein LOC126234346 [Schistocerca nitens]
MLRQALAVLLIAAAASASYPKRTVLFQDPTAWTGEGKCCMGVFNTPHRYLGAYKVTALYFSSHVRNYATLETGPEQQDINITMSEYPAGGDSWRVVGTGRYTGVSEPTQLLRIPITYQTDPTAAYLFEIVYGGPLTYPAYGAIDVSAGPYNTTSNYFILGIDYENP